MNSASNRFLMPRLALASLAAITAFAVPAAHADVLEIGHQGAVWITASAQPAMQVRDLAVDAAPSDGGASYTGVSAAAGPDAWRNHVGSLAAKYDISPALLEAVVWQESRWNTQAVSPAGARGLAQLMPATARQLRVDPNNPYANLEGGALYLRMQLDRFDGNIEKALAAYNAGPGRVERAGGIPPIRETREYVASIMARLSLPVRR